MSNYRVSFHGRITPPQTLHSLTLLANNAGYDVTNIIDRRISVLVLGDDITERPVSARAFGLCTMTIKEFMDYAQERITWLNTEASNASA